MPDEITSELDGSEEELEGLESEEESEQEEESSDDETEEGEASESEEGEEDAEEEDKEDPLETLRKELTADFDKKLDAKDKEISRLGYALRTASKDKVDTKGDESQFTDAQLLTIMQEHKDDPTVLLQVMKEVANSKGKEVEASAAVAADIKTKTTQFEDFLTRAYPETLKDDTEQHRAVETAIEYLHLGEHPFGKYLAISAMQMQQMPKLIEKIKADTKKEILGKTAEEKRKEKIKQNASSSSRQTSKNKPATLSKTQAETAQKLFPNDKKLQARYANLISKKSGTYTASVQ